MRSIKLLSKVSFVLFTILFFSMDISPAMADDSVIAKSKVDASKVLEVLNIVAPVGGEEDASKIKSIADSFAGVDKKMDVEVTKGIFLTYAGTGNKYNLKTKAPLAVITIWGNTNEYQVTKSAPFDGGVLFIKIGGSGNIYKGGDAISADQFRSLVKK